MKKILFWLILAIFALIMLALPRNVGASYCECLGRQPYISTKRSGSECLTLVYDPMDYFAGQSMVEYLYSSMEYCKY